MTNPIIIKRILNEMPQFRFTNDDYINNPGQLNIALRYFYLLLHDYENGENYENDKKVRSTIKNGLYPILNGKMEPIFDITKNGVYLVLVQSLALIRNKEQLWNLFNNEEQKKITTLMKMFILMWNFHCNSKNNFTTTMSLKRDILNKNDPIFKLSNDLILPFCFSFFNENEVKNIAENTDYMTLMKELYDYKFFNAFKSWATPSFTLSNGKTAPGSKDLFGSAGSRKVKEAFIKKTRQGITNEYYAGSGIGCIVPLEYNGYRITTFPKTIIDSVFNNVFSGGKCKSVIHINEEEDFSAHTNGISPYENEEGMMLSFNFEDETFGQKSSIRDADICFVLVLTTLKSLEHLKSYTIDNFKKDLILTGMNDFIYKKENGYQGYNRGLKENDLNLINSNIYINYWKELYGGK